MLCAPLRRTSRSVFFLRGNTGVAILKSLIFTTLPQPGANPTLDRRQRVIERLEEQKRLVADPNYKRTIRTSVRKDGAKTVVETQQRVMPSRRMTGNGTFVFFIRAGQKPIEFEKGTAGIAVASLDKLPSVIATVIAAVRAGELDEGRNLRRYGRRRRRLDRREGSGQLTRIIVRRVGVSGLKLPKSVYAGPREFDDLTPPLGFVGDELAEFSG